MTKKEKNAKNLIKRGKFVDAIDEYNAIAHDYRKSGDLEKAIEFCEKGSELAQEHCKYFEGSFSERLLSELHALLGNRASCLQHLSSFRRLARKAGNKSQEQLTYHVEAWCLQQLYQNGAADRTDIQNAIQAAETSRKMVDQYKSSFKDSDPGGSAKNRKADLFILEAQLQEPLGCNSNSKAMELLEKAKPFLSHNEKSRWYELRRTQCSVAPIGRRIDIAELMEDEAPEDKKAQALVELSHLYVVFNRLSAGYKKLAMVYITHGRSLIDSELEEISKRLGILYRLVKYSKILANPKTARISLCELHEAIGDLYDKYYQTMMEKEKKEYRHFVKENILKNFEKMLCHKRNDEDVLRAYLAMALVYGDLEENGKALELFEKRLAILESKGAGEEKIIDTRLSILNCQCKLGHLDVESKFEELRAKVTMEHHKKELFDIWATYWAEHSNPDEERKWRELSEKIPEVFIKNEDDETDILFGRMTEQEVLEKVVNENSLLKLDNMSEYQLKKTNDKGETILHQEAQVADNEAVLEKLCKLGCDVNAKDNGGWTPLSEAVAHDEVGNARILLRYGADVNARSVESFVSSEESQDSGPSQNHTGLTPLMEACTNGFVKMARLLMENKARVEMKDSMGWTAWEHLRRFISENEKTEELTELEEFLRNETKKFGNNTVQKFSTITPSSSVKSLRNGREVEIDDSPPDEDEELMILDSVVSSRKRRFSSQSIDDLTSISKRKPRSGENFSRPSSTNFPQKKKENASIFNIPKNPNLPISRRSLSPRRSISPTNTIRSAPSVFGDNDDVQYVGVKKRPSLSPKRPSPKVTPIPPKTPRAPPPSQSPQNLDILPVKCIFELPPGAEKIHPRILPLNRTLTIGETKARVLEQIQSGHLRMSTVYKNDDADKCLLADELQLGLVATQNTALVFRLTAPPAYEIYEQLARAPLPEISDRLKLVSTDALLNLSNLFIDENDMTEVSRTLSKCQRPEKLRIEIGPCDFSPEDETNLRPLLENCQILKIGASTGFFGAFQNVTLTLETLEIVACDFRDETQITRILRCCPNLKTLKLAAIRVKNRRNSIGGGFAETIGELQNLKSLDLSCNPWISDESWTRILSKSDKLEELTIDETELSIEFESYWLCSLTSFCARGSVLHWDSVAELLSVIENIDRIDLKYCKIDQNLVDELKKREGLRICVNNF